MKKLIFILSFIVLGISFNSCNDDDSSASEAKYPYNVRMTDAPGPYDAVNVDVVGVEVINEDHTVLLNVDAGIYNLLDLTNGVSTLIATSAEDESHVSQIRLILGTNNSVVVNGTSYPLSTPSADQSGLKILVNQTFHANTVNTILIDFDANLSVVETGAGVYKLKPVLRTIAATSVGTIKGNITPIGTIAAVSATSTTTGVVYTSNVNDAGNFQILGLPPGTYTVTITPLSPLLPVVQTNVVVTANVETNIGVIAF
ncbi:DUF4382 domain-containing protein [Flavobacterium sp.]|uniref:DUF4382 domain-containing protein n=1 Tax=Flavobacterium sp. TaxID=239 RepID=UPI002638D7F4|nr:DUF4382 domain-containing protein [Flavobacterium sp.]